MIQNYFKLNKLNLIKLFIFLSFIICWQSISTKFEDLLIQKTLSEINFFEIINFIRHSLIYFIFPILLFLNISLFKNFNKKSFKLSILMFFLFLYFCFQIPGLIFTQNSILNISYVISSFNLIMLINIGNLYLSNNERKIFIYISLFFLILILLLVYPPLLKILFTGEISFYGFFTTSDPLFLDKASPRATGISRTILFILIFFDYLNLCINNRYKKSISTTIRIFCFYNIFLFQSRTVIVLMFVYIIFIFIYEDQNNLKNIIKKITFNLLIPLTLVYFTFLINYQVVHDKKILKLESFQDVFEVFQETAETAKILEVTDLPTRKVREDNFSSGRTNDWINLSKKIHLSPFIGHGAQADRFLINQSASNGLLYAITSSGIIGLIFYIIFSFMAFLKSILNIINKKLEYETRLISLGVLLILARSILESSYAVFSLDLILLLSILNLIDSKKSNV